MIRDAVYKDIELLLPLAVEMHTSSKSYAYLKLDLNKVRDYAKMYIDHNNKYFRVYDKGNHLSAFFLGHLSKCFFGNQIVAAQAGLFTDEETPMCGIRLSKDFERWCKKRGAVEVTYGITTSHDRERHDKFMSRLGYSDCGTVYKKRL